MDFAVPPPESTSKRYPSSPTNKAVFALTRHSGSDSTIVHAETLAFFCIGLHIHDDYDDLWHKTMIVV
jgi:hypothetical protein